MAARRSPWTVEKIPGGFKVLDANGQSLAPMSMAARVEPMPTLRAFSPWTRHDA